MIAVLEDWESAGAHPPEQAPPQIVLADCYLLNPSEFFFGRTWEICKKTAYGEREG